MNQLYVLIRRLYLTAFWLLAALTVAFFGVNTYKFAVEINKPAFDWDKYPDAPKTWDATPPTQAELDMSKVPDKQLEVIANSKSKYKVGDLRQAKDGKLYQNVGDDAWTLVANQNDRSTESRGYVATFLEYYEQFAVSLALIVLMMVLRQWVHWMFYGKLSRILP